MIITIQSNNEYLHDILNKNPHTNKGLDLKTVNNNMVIGECQNNQYKIIVSPKGELHKQLLSYNNFSNSVNVNRIFKNYFKHFDENKYVYEDTLIPWLNKRYYLVDTEYCSITIEGIKCTSNWIYKDEFVLSKYIENLKVEEIGYNLYNIKLTAKNVYQAVNTIRVIAFFIDFINDDTKYVGKEEIEKYGNMILNIDNVEYFIYYLFLKRLNDYNIDNSIFIDNFEKKYYRDFNQSLLLTGKGTQKNRIEFVKQHINEDDTILDYGCGAFDYFKNLRNNIKQYIGYDITDYTNLYNKLKSEKYKNYKWNFVNEIKDVYKYLSKKRKALTVIVSEVVEHNVNSHLLLSPLKIFNVKKMIITTPNKAFNYYYKLGDNKRHKDHLRELTFDEFKSEITNTLIDGGLKNKYQINFYNIGDKILTSHYEHITPTMGAVLTKRTLIQRINLLFSNEK